MNKLHLRIIMITTKIYVYLQLNRSKNEQILCIIYLYYYKFYIKVDNFLLHCIYEEAFFDNASLGKLDLRGYSITIMIYDSVLYQNKLLI